MPSRRQLQEYQADEHNIVVRYKCLFCKHEFTQHFNRVTDTEDERARCPECGKQAIWKCIDVHRENPGVA